MKVVTFNCSKCGFQMSAETKYCGQIVRCAQCGSEVQIPENTALPPALSDIPQQQRVKSPIASKPFPILPILLGIIAGLQLGCLILLLCINLNTKSSPESYEYKTQTFDRYHRSKLTEKLQELGKEGWEYVGLVSNGEMLLRRIKITSDKSEPDNKGNE